VRKIHFAAWIGEDWPGVRDRLDRKMGLGFAWTRFRRFAAGLTRSDSEPDVEMASPERVEAPPSLTS